MYRGARDREVRLNIDGLEDATPEDEAFFADGPGRGGLKVHRGDLVVSTHLADDPFSLLVQGDLRVEGTVWVESSSALGVTGDLRCRNLYCAGELLVDGMVHVDEVALGFYPGGRSCFELAAARLLLAGRGHDWELTGAQRAEVLVEFDDYVPAPAGRVEQLARVLSERGLAALGELLGVREDGEEDELLPLMKAGELLLPAR